MGSSCLVLIRKNLTLLVQKRDMFRTAWRWFPFHSAL